MNPLAIPFPAYATIRITKRNSGSTGLISHRWFEVGEIIRGTYNKVYTGDYGLRLLVDGDWFFFWCDEYELLSHT